MCSNQVDTWLRQHELTQALSYALASLVALVFKRKNQKNLKEKRRRRKEEF